MDKLNIKKENYGKFIFKGSLAVEFYNDIDNTYEKSYISYNEKLSDYRKKSIKNNKDTEYIVNELKELIKKMGINNFTIYDDGGVDCNLKYNKSNKKDNATELFENYFDSEDYYHDISCNGT